VLNFKQQNRISAPIKKKIEAAGVGYQRLMAQIQGVEYKESADEDDNDDYGSRFTKSVFV
jgi:hypothetical protein